MQVEGEPFVESKVKKQSVRGRRIEYLIGERISNNKDKKNNEKTQKKHYFRIVMSVVLRLIKYRFVRKEIEANQYRLPSRKTLKKIMYRCYFGKYPKNEMEKYLFTPILSAKKWTDIAAGFLKKRMTHCRSTLSQPRESLVFLKKVLYILERPDSLFEEYKKHRPNLKGCLSEEDFQECIELTVESIYDRLRVLNKNNDGLFFDLLLHEQK